MRNTDATQLDERTKETATTDLDSDAAVDIPGTLRPLLVSSN